MTDTGTSSSSLVAATAPTSPAPLLRPAELDLLDLERSAVIEASAGTGKTYLLEHLVLELLITGRARLEDILVVTFTERATAELVTGVRGAIDLALSSPQGGTTTGWLLDASAHARLTEARQSFDQATIATIHSFCQGVLTDQPLATRRLLAQTQVDARQAFGDAFRDGLRHTLAATDGHPAYLDTYLGARRSVEDLERLLFDASATRGTWAIPFDEGALRDLTERLARLNPDAPMLGLALREKKVHSSTVTAMLKRLRRLASEANAALTTGACARMLGCFEANVEIFASLEKVAALTNIPPALAPLHQIACLAPVAAPPLDDAIAQRFLPLVEARLRTRKLAEGLYDFDDMITAVDDALDGALGPTLIGQLRRRFKFALIDEAQDTEPAQWRIFRRVFLDSAEPRPVVLIGDPKQAIYGFRGADVNTYVQAREDIRAGGGTILTLAQNFRSHPEVVAAYNAILAHDATPRYFSGEGIAYDHPVTAAKAPLGTGPGVTLFTAAFPPEYGKPARIGTIKLALQGAITREIQRLRTVREAPPLSRIYVLVRSNAEAREIASCLHRAGIANVLFKPDDIFDSAEATHVRALLTAISDPSDRAARLRAWLTPFFDVSLDDLAAVADPPPHHPLIARLTAWKALGDAHAYDDLWARILDDSGIARRLRLSTGDLRRLTNYRHLFDILHAQASARPVSVADLAALLGALAAGYRRGTNDNDTQRLETEAQAVRIMTIHAAKGLEADVVFVYGGLVQPRSRRGALSVFHHESRRLRCAGKPRLPLLVERISATRQEEGQRLMYVALTRARKHVYLPFFPEVDPGDSETQGEHSGGDFDPFSKITGEYRHVNQRLRALLAEPAGAALFDRRTLEAPTVEARDKHAVLADVALWTPPSEVCAAPGDAGDLSRAQEVTMGLRTRRRGFAITSYSRLVEAMGAYRPAKAAVDADMITGGAITADDSDSIEMADPLAAAIVDPLERLNLEGATPEGAAARDALPGGLASGLFLHAILEKAALGELPPLADWREQVEVRHLIESEARRWDREPRFFAEAARLVHAALTVPIRMPDGSTLSGVARAARVRREVGFLFPLPDASALLPVSVADSTEEDALVHERGFVRGALDVLFQHGGRVCFADWKSNVLPSFSSEAVRAHVTLNYDLQVRIYTLALVRMLGIRNRDDYERRFGGLVYLFLRGLVDAAGQPRAAGDDGLFVHRPEYSEVEQWTQDLARRRVAGAGGQP